NVFTLKIAKAFDAEPSSLVATTKIIISLVSSYKYDISPILDELPEDSKIRSAVSSKIANLFMVLTKDLAKDLVQEKVDLTKDLMQKLADVKDEKSELTKDLMQKLADNDIKYRTELLLRSKRMCNVKGALEFIRSMDKTTSFRDPTDSVLMKLVQDAKFVSYLKQICLANNSRYKDVEKCMGGLYHTVSKQLHGHDKDIEIDARDWSVNEVLTLGALFHYYNIPYYYDEEGQLTEYLYILQNSSVNGIS
ncbi:14498_t:CDS:2, partial [Entrophospora sp. SA101]